jgi:hypothetical protein
MFSVDMEFQMDSLKKGSVTEFAFMSPLPIVNLAYMTHQNMLLSVTFVTDITLEWLHTLDWESTKT